MAIGKVVYVSPNFGMLVVMHDDGFSVVQMIGSEGDIKSGDDVSADWSEIGGGTLRRGVERFDVYFQGNWGRFEEAVAVAYRTGGGS